ncbi:hypothetical protein CEXT_229791 [Caerostris extrusa]|uniref:Uncharacterized protein n=1 Tax=Caerostris extrusa TaxID=172846 RepID=A0AAV4MNN3_CAEEX|nr:hypothetical protein CEXT_229791 [Caerostris extrusa]
MELAELSESQKPAGFRAGDCKRPFSFQQNVPCSRGESYRSRTPAADVPVPFLSSRFKSRLMSLQSDLLAAATVAVSDACPSTWSHPSPLRH